LTCSGFCIGKGGPVSVVPTCRGRSVSVFLVILCTFFGAGLQSLMAGPGSRILFGTDARLGHLLNINPTTGAASFIGNIGFPTPSLAMDAVTGILYGGRGAGLPNLYRINTSTGAPTLVGNSGLGFAAIGSLDFSPSGIL